jgi:AraC-like DNA-binding protein
VTVAQSRKEASVSVRLVWPFLRLAGSGPQTVEVIERCGITPAELAEPDARLSHRAAMRLLEDVVEALGDPSLGLRAGQQLEPGDLDVLEYCARCAANLGDAIQLVRRYLRLLDEAAETALEHAGNTAKWCFWVTDGVVQPSAANDFSVAAALGFARRNCAIFQPPLEVHVMHERPDYIDAYKQAFAAPVLFSKPQNAIVFQRSYLAVPMRQANPRISAAFELHARGLLEKLRHQRGIVGRVREEVAMQLAALGAVTMEHVAKRLATSVPTLRRRLEAEAVTFTRVVDDLRRELAEQYLRDPAKTVSEVALLLGFSHVAAFDRAFKRWTGASPTEYRARSRNE